jgi:hypothetical protein
METKSRYAYIRTGHAVYDRAKVLQHSSEVLRVEFFRGGGRVEEAVHTRDVVRMIYYRD